MAVIEMDTQSVISGLTALRERLSAFRDSFMEDASAMLESALQDGEQAMHQRILAAETTTGLARAEHGGLPGRIEMGTMDDGISHDVTTEGDTITGTLGWIGTPPEYTVFQEYGTGANFNDDLADNSVGHSSPGAGVPHVHALVDGMTIAKQIVTDELMSKVADKVFNA